MSPATRGGGEGIHGDDLLLDEADLLGVEKLIRPMIADVSRRAGDAQVVGRLRELLSGNR